MTESPSPALRVALAYYKAWTGKDIEAAMGHLADDVVCDAPAGRIEGVEAYREFLGPFAQMLLGDELLAAFGDQSKAVLVYDTRTPPVASAPGGVRVSYTSTALVSSPNAASSSSPRSVWANGPRNSR